MEKMINAEGQVEQVVYQVLDIQKIGIHIILPCTAVSTRVFTIYNSVLLLYKNKQVHTLTASSLPHKKCKAG